MSFTSLRWRVTIKSKTNGFQTTCSARLPASASIPMQKQVLLAPEAPGTAFAGNAEPADATVGSSRWFSASAPSFVRPRSLSSTCPMLLPAPSAHCRRPQPRQLSRRTENPEDPQPGPRCRRQRMADAVAARRGRNAGTETERRTGCGPGRWCHCRAVDDAGDDGRRRRRILDETGEVLHRRKARIQPLQHMVSRDVIRRQENTISLRISSDTHLLLICAARFVDHGSATTLHFMSVWNSSWSWYMK